MGREEIMQRFFELDEKGKEELLEKITFCSFADDWEFKKYFRLDERQPFYFQQTNKARKVRGKTISTGKRRSGKL